MKALCVLYLTVNFPHYRSNDSHTDRWSRGWTPPHCLCWCRSLGEQFSVGARAHNREVASCVLCSENLGLDASYEQRRNIKNMSNKNTNISPERLKMGMRKSVRMIILLDAIVETATHVYHSHTVVMTQNNYTIVIIIQNTLILNRTTGAPHK